MIHWYFECSFFIICSPLRNFCDFHIAFVHTFVIPPRTTGVGRGFPTFRAGSSIIYRCSLNLVPLSAERKTTFRSTIDRCGGIAATDRNFCLFRGTDVLCRRQVAIIDLSILKCTQTVVLLRELLWLTLCIEVRASCFIDPGYYHTHWQFSQNLHKR